MSEVPAKRAVYLDYAATTPVDGRVAAAMTEALTRADGFGNPSSAHAFGETARAAVERARAQVAALIGAEAAEIVWTGSATEANNLAILGVARHALRGRKIARAEGPPIHIVTTRIEHKSVINPCKQLEKEGFQVTWVKPDADGIVRAAQVAQALRPETVLVSVMHVNNELGTINDIAAIGRLCHERKVAFHVDAVQAAGKVNIDVRALNVDLLSLGAHKIYGPKGIGALFVRRTPPLNIEPVIFGGGQEDGLRSGTLATHQIVGMGLACEIAGVECEADAVRIEPLREQLLAGLRLLGGTLRNPDSVRAQMVPHILNVSFEGVHGESLLADLDGLAVSSGSTCNSATGESSYVLRALGRSDALAEASLRFSLGRFTTEQDIDFAIETVTRAVRRLRDLSPANEMPAEAQDLEMGEAGSMGQGTWVKFWVSAEGGRIKQARFQVYGCPHTLAACEWLSRNLPGRATDAALPEGVQGLSAAIGAPAEKRGRLLLVEDALKDAL